MGGRREGGNRDSGEMIGGRGRLGGVNDEGGWPGGGRKGSEAVRTGYLSYISLHLVHLSPSALPPAFVMFKFIIRNRLPLAVHSRTLHILFAVPQFTLQCSCSPAIFHLAVRHLHWFREYRAASTVTGCIIQRMQLSLDSLLALWPHLRQRQTDERVIPW